VTDLAFASATEQAALTSAGEVSSSELVDLYLDRIDRLDGELNAYCEVTADAARADAKAKDDLHVTGGVGGPFHGVPISIKYEHFLSGTRMTVGTRALADFVTPFDSENVARLKQAGFVPLGKTAMPELGTVGLTESLLHGVTRNPWDLGRTPGGSSGGAGAALAAGLCPVADGGDGLGSIRIPASCCGLFGLKPSRDRVSNAPLFGDFAFGLVTPAVLSRTVLDAASVLDLISGYVLGDPGMAPPPDRPFADEVGVDPGPLRIGVATSGYAGTAEPEALAGVDAARYLLESLGHETKVVEIPFPHDVVDSGLDIVAVALGSQPIPPDLLEPHSRWLVDRAYTISGARYVQAQAALQLGSRAIVGLWSSIDVLLTPTLNELPWPAGTWADWEPEELFRAQARYAQFVAIFNITGQPAVSVPLHWDDTSGLPVGVQLVGPAAGESLLIRLSSQLETASPWRDRTPPGY